MCILFFNSKSNPESGEYKLILANVRDEYYSRPTQPLFFWDNETQIIGAKDLEKGREGGTWLAMNKNGKIGTLLNILQPDSQLKANKKSRGFLVVDYLKNNLSPQTYLEQISEDMIEYNGFRMIAFDIKAQNSQISVFSNFNPTVRQLDSGTHAFGNNQIEDKLWPKVENGKQKFEQIVNKYNKTSCKPELIEALFQLLSDKTIYPLDEQMRSQGKGKSIEFLEKVNAINVNVPEIGYGSRTWTVILVDNSLNVDYIEKTMKEPIDTNKDIQWITTTKTFKIQ